ncbi:hypothetical protein C8J57DRAFT_1221466 [Mycena rebaudengoi]|nr:hypothetical protein C8J57DRAFT_1221466 [Mycena rebaudengoi]
MIAQVRQNPPLAGTHLLRPRTWQAVSVTLLTRRLTSLLLTSTDDEAHLEPDLHHGTTDEGEPGENEYGVYSLTFSGESLNPPRSAGAIFSNAQHFVVTGGNFTITTYLNWRRRVFESLPDFRRLPMGDLDLRAEIYLDDHNSVVYRRERQASARRIYSARIPVDSKMTVAVYQGNNAKEVVFLGYDRVHAREASDHRSLMAPFLSTFRSFFSGACTESVGSCKIDGFHFRCKKWGKKIALQDPLLKIVGFIFANQWLCSNMPYDQWYWSVRHIAIYFRDGWESAVMNSMETQSTTLLSDARQLVPTDGI